MGPGLHSPHCHVATEDHFISKFHLKCASEILLKKLTELYNYHKRALSFDIRIWRGGLTSSNGFQLYTICVHVLIDKTNIRKDERGDICYQLFFSLFLEKRDPRSILFTSKEQP